MGDTCSTVIVETREQTRGEDSTRDWLESKRNLCSQLACYSYTEDQELEISSGQHDVGGTTCILAVWKKVPQSAPEYLDKICQGTKRCFGMVLTDSDSDLDKIGENIYQPTLPF